MKPRLSHHHSVSKSKADKTEKRSKHEISVSNIKHKVSQTMGSAEFKRSKMKTEGSHSKSKSNADKGKLLKLKSKQKTLKPRVKGSYDISHKDKQISHTNTDRRRASIKTHHKTQINYEDIDMECRISQIRNNLSQLPSPSCDIKQMKKYYNSILQIIGDTEDPLHSMLLILHSLYTAPMQEMFDIMVPYQNLLLKRKQIFEHVQNQIQKNKHFTQQINLQSDQIQIKRLQAIIQNQRMQISERKQIEKVQNKSTQKLGNSNTNQVVFDAEMKKKDFKIDLGILKDHRPIGYHQQFLSMLPEMSQSWRDQAMKEKRY